METNGVVDCNGNEPVSQITEDEEDEEIEDKSCWFRMGPLRFNPVVSFFAIVIIAVFVAMCCVFPTETNSYFGVAKTWITRSFTWLYVGSQDIWAILIIWLYFTKYADLKLGKDDEEPEFSTGSWFVMLFACGIGVGLFFYGVAEPIFHYTGRNRYTADPTIPDNTLAQIAMNVTLYHWGIHGWIVYCIMGMLLAIMAYRKGLPMTVKSCFYPLLGDKIFTWVGDVIDILSIMTTLFGVCTSLGLGVIQVNTGINYINPSIEINSTNQFIIIWCITAVATMSTLSGVGMGIRRLSEICFLVGLFVMAVCFFLDESWFILNLFTQSVGYYFQYIMQIGWHCDAFELLGPSDGRGDRFRSPDIYDGSVDAPQTATGDGPEGWMDGWTMFYWGWWISWSPFVGMFIARISKGRTIREFINGTLTAPILYSFLWLVIFGGAAFNQERAAASYKLCCNNFNLTAITNETAFLDSNFTIGSICSENDCNECSKTTFDDMKTKYIDQEDIFKNLNRYTGNEFITHKDTGRNLQRLSCLPTAEMWFSLMSSYGQMGNFLCIFSLIGIILYFVTSSDSGSYVIDCLSANGDPDPPRVQRAFWALLEGATATALLAVGGTDGLSALQTMAVITGLPYTIIICFMCISLIRVLQVEFGELSWTKSPRFKYHLLEPITTLKCNVISLAILNIFVAPWTFAKCLSEMNSSRKRTTFFYAFIFYLFLIGFVVFHACNILVDGLWSLAWVCFITFATCGSSIRTKFRNENGIPGNAIEDFFAALIVYPFVATQLHYKSVDPRDKRKVVPAEVGMHNGAFAVSVDEANVTTKV